MQFSLSTVASHPQGSIKHLITPIRLSALSYSDHSVIRRLACCDIRTEPREENLNNFSIRSSVTPTFETRFVIYGYGARFKVKLGTIRVRGAQVDTRIRLGMSVK